MSDPPSCVDTFKFFTSTPLVVQQPPTHRLLVVIPVRRDCCSAQCEDSARVTYFTAPTSSTIAQARPNIDFVEARGTVLFGLGQERAQVAIEVLPAHSGDVNAAMSGSSLHQRAFAVILEAPVDSSTLARTSTEITVEESLLSSPRISTTSRISESQTVVAAFAVAGLILLAVCWFRLRNIGLPRRTQAFEYKVLLLSRRHSGVSEESREALVATTGRNGRKNGVRRIVRRDGSFKNWWTGTGHRRHEVQDLVAPASTKLPTTVQGQEGERDEGEENENEPQRVLRHHLATIQSAYIGR